MRLDGLHTTLLLALRATLPPEAAIILEPRREG